MKGLNWLMPLGMVSVVAYVLHVFLGQHLWKTYDPITTDISSLTAVDAPNAELLNAILLVYGLCFLLFVVGMVVKSVEKYHWLTRIGYLLFLVMAITTVVGYKLFPLTGDKTEMNFQNMMHIIVTIIVVFTTISALFLIGFGYLKQEKLPTFGKICIATATLITLFGALNPIGMAQGWNILGLTERMVIFPLQAFVFFLSYIYTTNNKLIVSDE
ncbi:DUF998 domain-containing protein [Enterococcus sp. DIV1298c]|uniref:DUF998 domain-containing protein n=1 Tax=Candidatus Enterococcus mangumiae TaxID=2230878 RepID=A0ABZ2T0R2_9ENTE|nr:MULTISPECIES: DUF998 domain-containing protein [unclassified Enterococcus]MBO0461474.1 DUF998 domain-containing protein [Enterococcus sp. DIV1298c]MBO0489197.1 DUF998 domain-containing protein [Enterococcus sp. DIV1094]